MAIDFRAARWLGLGRLQIASAFVFVLMAATLLAPLAAADEFQPYVEPATQQARQIKDLFDLTFIIAMVIFVGVEALLFFVLWKFRNNKTPPPETGHRGHTTAEIVWTAIPALILLMLGVISAGTLFELDTVPDDTDYTVKVEAGRFFWRFTYPDGNFSLHTAGSAAPGEASDWNASKQCQPDRVPSCRPVSAGAFRVEEGQRIRLEITALDVIHALWIPEFGVKIDAVPGTTNYRWFEAPAFVPGGDNEYFIQCAEFCGSGHHAMHASVTVVPAGTFAQGYPQPNPVEPEPEAPATNETT